MIASNPSGTWLWNLVDAGARSLLMGAVVGTCLRLLRVSHVMARKVAWTLVLYAALMMPVLAPWAAKQSWIPVQAAVVPVQTWLNRLPSRTAISAPGRAAPLRRIFPTRVEALPVDNNQPPIGGQPMSREIASSDHFPTPAIAMDGEDRGKVDASSRSVCEPTWEETLFLIYAAVCIILLNRIAMGGIAAARLWWRSTPALNISGQSDIGPKIRWSREVSSPVTVGSGILLPEDYTSWDAEKLRIVLAHESSHVRQGDFYLQLSAALYAALFWFSPLGWWLKRTLCDLGEATSDRAAVSEAATHASYAQVLLEFAALPRTIRLGVAMAREGRLSHRINRLLDESSFRRAFTGGSGRIAVAALLAPVALFAATSLIRVQAAGQAPPAPPAPAIPQAPAAADVPLPAAPGTPALPPAPREPAEMGEPPVAPGPPSQPGAIPPKGVRIIGDIGSGDSYSYPDTQSESSTNSHSSTSPDGRHYSYSYSDDGDSYALISGKDKEHINFSGDWMEGRREQLDKARQMAHGDFLWFTHQGKSYIVDDPAIVGQIADMYKPMEELGRRQEELGRQQEELGRQQEKLGERMNEVTIPTPDVSKEMAQLNAAMAELNAAKGKTVTQEQLGELQEKLAELQGKLGGLQGEVGARQGEIGEQQGELGAKQGRLGEQQGRLGEEQGRISREADRKVKSIIDQSLKNGNARPVE